MVNNCYYDRQNGGCGRGSCRLAAQSGGCPSRPAVMRQDDPGARICRDGSFPLLRSGGPSKFSPPNRTRHRATFAKKISRYIDEIQRRPGLFPLLRVLADRRPLPARFLILGSASPDLLRQSSESLAGRIETVPLEGFRLADLGAAAQTRHWLRGGFPLAYTARTEADSFSWRRQFLQTFIERDLPQLGITIPALALRRFWNMVAHYHAQTWNSSELARALSVSEATVRRYLDLMADVFMLRQLPPWFENLGKRQVKAPKVYVRDSGLLHALLGIRNHRDLEFHPKVGASWEGYAVEEVLKSFRPDEAYYWATHNGAELDLLLFKNGRRIGVECKRVDAPALTPSMRIALTDLKLDRLCILYPGDRRYSLAKKVEVIPLAEFVNAE